MIERYYSLYLRENNGIHRMPGKGLWTLQFLPEEGLWVNPLVWIEISKKQEKLAKEQAVPYGSWVILECDINGVPLAKNAYKIPNPGYSDDKLLAQLSKKWPTPDDQQGDNCPLRHNRPKVCPTKGRCPEWCYDETCREDYLYFIKNRWVLHSLPKGVGGGSTIPTPKEKTKHKCKPEIVEENNED